MYTGILMIFVFAWFKSVLVKKVDKSFKSLEYSSNLDLSRLKPCKPSLLIVLSQFINQASAVYNSQRRYNCCRYSRSLDSVYKPHIDTFCPIWESWKTPLIHLGFLTWLSCRNLASSYLDFIKIYSVKKFCKSSRTRQASNFK